MGGIIVHYSLILFCFVLFYFIIFLNIPWLLNKFLFLYSKYRPTKSLLTRMICTFLKPHINFFFTQILECKIILTMYIDISIIKIIDY